LETRWIGKRQILWVVLYAESAVIMRQPVIGVMGPGEQATVAETQTAYELGQQIAAAGWVLLTGGRNVGVMDAASRGAKSVGGLTIGILPTSDRTHISTAVDLAIMTEMGQARNAINVLSSDAVIACGMGLGTASEVALALKSGKVVVLLRGSPEDKLFFSQFAQAQLHVVDRIDEAIEIVRQQLKRS